MISIVVPVYKAADYIVETMNSVAAQTFRDWELILVDDCSPDDSVQIIRQYMSEHLELKEKIRLVHQPENAGAAMARNRGVEEAAGRYIAFLDADDIWLPEKLEKELEYMQACSAPFVFTSYEFGDENAVPTGKAVRAPHTITFRQALTRTVIFTSTVLFDTEKIDKEQIKMPQIGSEDTALWWKLLKSGITAYGLDEILVIYRRPQKSLSSNKLEAIRRIWKLYREVAGLSPVAAAIYLPQWAIRAALRRMIPERKGK